MYALDRQLVVIKPKQPFYNWLKNINKRKISLEDIRGDCTAFLIPVSDNLSDAEKYIRSKFTEIFDMELSEWNIDEKLWPNDRTVEMFKEWFDVYFHSTIIDTVEKEILKDELF
ncbi:MAG: hypothetical protein NTX22_10080 [Ignavibacteriales bacterium]|nr:hypothetical protein [Ignavibacteriales bacterium]